MVFLNVPEKLFLFTQPLVICHPCKVASLLGHPCPEIALKENFLSYVFGNKLKRERYRYKMEVHILSFMMDIFFAFTLHILYKKILGIRFENKVTLILGWCICLIIWNVSSYAFAENPLINGFSSLIVNFLVLNILYAGNIRAKFVLVFVVIVLGIISEVIVVFGMALLNISINDKIQNRNDFIFIGNAISKIICFIFVKIITFISGRQKHVKIALSEWVDIFLVPIGSVLIIYIVERNDNFRIDIWKVIFFGILLVINLATYYVYQKVQENALETINQELLKQQNEYYKARYAETQKQWANLRKIKHDMINNYVLELSYLENKKYEELEDVYVKAIGSLKKQKNIVDTGNIGIDSIINYKMEMAKGLDIEIKQEIKIGSRVCISNEDLNVLLGNLFDNAIEAVGKVPKGKRIIEFKISSDETALLFEISNTYNGIINKNHKGEIMTTKIDSENHGIGLKAVQEIVNRYAGKFCMEQEKDKVLIKIFLYY